MKDIEFRTLGPLDLRIDGRSLEDVLGRSKQVALLAVVAAEGVAGPVRRERLASILWPESDDVRARRSLRQALYELRHALGSEAIVGRDPEHVELGRVWCDVCEFGERHQAGDLEGALELYRGEFLAGFHLNHDGREFERWLAPTQRSIAETAAKAATTLADRAERAGDGEASLRWLERRLELAPYDEAALRRRMKVLLDRGDVPQAIQAYHEFARRLERDLGLTPGDSTTELAGAIGALGGKYPSSPLRPTVTPPARRSPVSPGGVGPADPARPDAPPRERELRRRFSATPIALAATVTVILVAGVAILPGLLESETLDRHRVLVADFANETGDQELDIYGRLAADWIVGGIVDSRTADVVRRMPGTYLRNGEDRDARLRPAAVESGAGTAVWGALYRVADRLHWRAFVQDVETGRVLVSVGPVSWSEAHPDSALTVLRDQLLGGVAAAADARIGDLAGRVGPPPDVSSYRSFREGLRLYGQEGDYVGAANSFRRAGSGDSDFPLARIWEALAISSALGDATASPAMLERYPVLIDQLLREDRPLSSLERHLIDYVRGHHAGDWPLQLSAIQHIVDLVPNSEYLLLAAKARLRDGDAYGAIETLRSIDLEEPWVQESGDYWMLLAQAYHEVGELPASLEAAREARVRHPQSIRSLFWLGMTLAALGRTDELEEVVNTAMAYDHESWIQHPGGLMLWTALELRTHGWEGDTDLLNRAREWYEDESHVPSNPALNAWFQAQRVRLLLELGRLDEARVIAEALYQRRDDLSYVPVWPLGLVAAAEGEREEADQLESELGTGGGASTHKRALMAAMMGESDRALDLLAQAEALGHRMFDMTHRWGSQLQLSQDPRFQELIAYPRH